MSLLRAGWLGAVLSTTLALAAACGGATGSGVGGAATTSSTTGGAGGILLSSSSSSSSSSGAGGFTPTGFSCSGAKPSLANDVVPITTQSCTGVEGCHLLLHSAQGLYDMMVGKPAAACADGRDIVTPGDAEHSYVIHKITNHDLCAGGSMPPAATLQDAQIQLFYDWICDGAQNN